MNYQAVKNIVLYQDPSSSSFTFNFSNITFKPDILIVRSISWEKSSGSDKLVIIKTDMLNDPLCSFNATNVFNEHVEIIHKLDKTILGDYNFSMINSSNTSTDLVGSLSIYLSFIKY